MADDIFYGTISGMAERLRQSNAPSSKQRSDGNAALMATNAPLYEGFDRN